ncbi:hypothetical protein ACS0TY_016721 [Phlomoides rotata]
MEESVYQDRLSELPDSLIHLILSFLPIRDVVSTTLLSKRWENLWTTVPYLNFSEIIREDEDEGNGTQVEDEGNGMEVADGDNGMEVADGDNGMEVADEGNGMEVADEGNDTEVAVEGDGTEDEDEGYGTEDDGTEDEDEDWTENEDSVEDENEEEDEGTEDEDEEYRAKTERIRNFVNRALISWKGIKILKFKIVIDIESHFGSSLDSDVHLWMLFAIKNKVEELEIITTADYCAPQCLNSCSSIRKLSLVGCMVQMDESPCWNQLKCLRIHPSYRASGCFSEELINQILLGSPELEVFELQIGSNCSNWNISSTSLKRLIIKNCLYFNEPDPYLVTLRISCPNLEKLEISGLFDCLFTDVSSLIDATLHLYNGNDKDDDYNYYGSPLVHLYELLGGTLEQVFSTVQHVEKIALSDFCVQVFGASHEKCSFSPLPNVKFLKLDIRRIELGDMVELLGIFPNLKTLVIEHHASTRPPFLNAKNNMEFKTNLSKSSLLQMKIIEITGHSFDLKFFGFIEFFLKHAIMLEKLVLRYTGITSSCEQQKTFSEKLLSLPRSSPTVEVIFKY